MSTFGMLTATSRSRASQSRRRLRRFEASSSLGQRGQGKNTASPPAIPLVSEPRHRFGGAAAENVVIGVDGKTGGCVFHACAQAHAIENEAEVRQSYEILIV